jgi:DNA polymerase elongation subunit (family B)
MSYISASKHGEQIFVWERQDQQRILKHYPAPYYFYIKSSKGEFTSMYGDKLARFDFNNSHEFNQAKMQCKGNGKELFESDIPPELKILSEHYYNNASPKLNTSFLDIEVDYDKHIGFSSISNPYAPINSVAIYHQHEKRLVVLAVPPSEPECPIPETGKASQQFIDDLNNISPLMSDVEHDIYFCRTERELLIRLLGEIENSDVVSGWNSDFFDIPYIGKRVEMMGRKYFNMLSFREARSPRWREVERYNQAQEMLDLGGRISIDYLELFKKYEVAERPSYKLESIADEVLPELPKLHYEGSLADLYRRDFTYFIRYNIRDTEILKGFEDRLSYVALANDMVHLSTGLFKHVGGTLKLAELATINYCHHELDNVIVNNLDITDNDGSIQGAFVLLPQVGMHQYVGSVDIKSLYPSSIRALNISPETLRGQFALDITASKEIAKRSYVNLELVYEDGTSEEYPAIEWCSILSKKKWAVSGSGTVFDQTTQGIIPSILENWYNQRKVYQQKMRDARKTGDKEEAAYYDRLQYVYKIKLNSFYGALTNKFFRFYDLRLGSSTTAVGRAILIHQCAQVVKELDGKYLLPDRHNIMDGKEHFGYTTDWSVVYGDTDSTYFNTHASSIDEAIIIADRVGELVNDTFPQFMRDTFLCNEGYDTLIQTSREVVTNRGIFVDKKRYILNIINDEGETVDKLKVMGLDTKKTTLPKAISLELNNFVGRLLRGEEWDVIAHDIVEYKDLLENTTDLMSIGLPKGIKGIEDYTKKLTSDGPNTRLPGHVAAGILYNMSRELYNDKESMPIVSGMKIKVFYITEKVGRFKSIAIPVDIETVPQWFYDNFKVDIDAHILRLVDKPIQNIIKAIGRETPSKQGLLTDSLLGF